MTSSHKSNALKSCMRKRFYRICIDGLCCQITCNYFMEELPGIQEEEAARYILEHLSFREPSAIGVVRTWFDSRKFYKMLCDPKENDMVHSILDLLEDYDLGMTDAYIESCLDSEEDDAFAKYYIDTVATAPLGYGWYLLKKKHNFLKRLSIINFWLRVAKEKKQSENSRGRIRSREEFEAECADSRSTGC